MCIGTDTMDVCHDHPADESHHLNGLHQLGFKMVGDNVDKTVKVRYIQVGQYSNKSLHHFQSFAVLNHFIQPLA